MNDIDTLIRKELLKIGITEYAWNIMPRDMRHKVLDKIVRRSKNIGCILHDTVSVEDRRISNDIL